MAKRFCLAVLLLAAAFPAPASAATVANGDFESGTLGGWHLLDSGAGDWFAYKGTEAPIGHHRGAAPVQAPPQGSFAAIADEADPATLILYQDLKLGEGSSEELSLLAYYDSYAPIAAPDPDTLATDEEGLGSRKNQQFRIDLIRPEAPLDTVAPGDILLTLFRTKAGAPRRMGPTGFSADLAPFAGQTVRLRIAVAAHEEVLNAGIDAVTLSARKADEGAGANRGRFRVVKTKLEPRKGIAKVLARAPAAGWVELKRRGHTLQAVAARAARARQVMVRLKLTSGARQALARKGDLVVRAKLRWEPDEGPTESVPLSLRFILKKS